jgi:hypothetical protein
MQRGNASNKRTVLLFAGDSLTIRFNYPTQARYSLKVRFSNDGPGTPLEQVQVSLDSQPVGTFTADNTRSTGMAPGTGWNEFLESPALGPLSLTPGPHTFVLAISGGDQYGVEIDSINLNLA